MELGERRSMAPRPGRRLLQLLAVLAVAWLGFGAWVRSRRAPRPPPPRGEMRGAYHVHTRKSDGRGSLADVVRAARAAGLQFLVVTDHNRISPEDAGWRDGVLVVEGSEISSPDGHIVALGISRDLTPEERQSDTPGSIRKLGGRAVVAHPFHPVRPFAGWSRDDWLGYEVISNDSFWGLTRRERALGRIGLALLALPFDPAQATLAFYAFPQRELARFDEVNRVAPGAAPPRSGPRHPLLCSGDAHGWPSYRSAFEAFSMHVAVEPTGDGGADGRAVVDRLLDGSAVCVFDGVAPASGVRVSLAPSGDRIRLQLATPDPARGAFRLLRDGALFGSFERSMEGGSFACGGLCPRGALYRVEGTWGGRPWIFTNPVWIE